ncbi:MAG: TonB-dependent receptor domain-containing protein, partial [Chitinophagaceae bacterium]
QGYFSAMADGGIKWIKGFAWRIQGTVKKGGNAKTPGYWLANSGSEEMNFSLTAGWKRKQSSTELFYSFFNTKLGIFSGSHIGNVTDLMLAINSDMPPVYIRDATFSYKIQRPYQHVQHQLFKLKSIHNLNDQNKINIVFSLQNNDRREYDIVRSPRKTPQLELALFTSALDASWDHVVNTKLKGTVGVFSSYQLNKINYRYFLPNYQNYDAGIFLIEKYTEGNWIVETGLRYDFKGIFDIHDNDPSPYDQYLGNALQSGLHFGKRNYSGLSGNFGFKYNLKNWIFNFNYGSAWRNPQPNELFSDGLHHGAARIEKGQYQLLPERSHAVSGGVEFTNGSLVLDGSIFYKFINDYIFLKPSYPPLLTIRGAFPVFIFDQSDIRMHGMDLSASYTISNHYKFAGKTSIIRAYDVKAKDWLIQMPSDRYEISGEYLFHDQKNFKETYLRLEVQNVSRQKRFPLTGNIEVKDTFGNISMQADYLLPPSGYSLMNMEIGTSIEVNHRFLSFIISANNLLNVKYRDYMNSFRYFSDEVGRNIVLRIKVPLEIEKSKHI